MRILDLLRLSIKTVRAKFAVLYVSLVILGVCGIYFACAVMHTVLIEKTEPCELEITSTEYKALSDETIWELMEIPDVLAATNRIELPVKLMVGEYEADLTLVGVDATYLNVQYNMGGVFPENSMMPWIVLNEETLKTFRDPTDTTRRASSYVPPVNWLEDDYVLSLGENLLVSKVSGIYESGDVSDAGYLDIETAKSILQEQGQTGEYSSAVVRIRNIGTAREVTQEVEALGYAVTNPNTELQTRWDRLQKEALYLALLGLAILLVASRQQKMEYLRQERRRESQFLALRWMGMTEKQIRDMRLIQNGFLCIIGVSLGMGTSYVIPRFFTIAQKTESVFLLELPLTAAAICWFGCVVGAFCLSREGWFRLMKEDMGED
jgi:hypothetical protein